MYTGGSEYPGGPETQWRLVMLQVVYVTNYGQGVRSGDEGWNRKKVGHARDRLSSFFSSFFFFFLFSFIDPARPRVTILLTGENPRAAGTNRGILVLVSSGRSTGPRSNVRSICHDIAAPLRTRRCVSSRSAVQRERELRSRVQCHASIRALSTRTYRIRPRLEIHSQIAISAIHPD